MITPLRSLTSHYVIPDSEKRLLSPGLIPLIRAAPDTTAKKKVSLRSRPGKILSACGSPAGLSNSRVKYRNVKMTINFPPRRDVAFRSREKSDCARRTRKVYTGLSLIGNKFFPILKRAAAIIHPVCRFSNGFVLALNTHSFACAAILPDERLPHMLAQVRRV